MENPSFFAIIPADVRYSDIMPNAKLLYGEITALANKTGYCYASNTYFADLYGVNSRQIIKWINQLEEHGFISKEISITQGNKRYISIVNKKTLPSEQKDTTLVNKKTLPSEQKDTHNNTLNNTDINTDIILIEKKEESGKETEDNIIDNIDDLRRFLNKGKLQEKYYYKIGDDESFERLTSDFFIFCDDNGRKMNKKTIEAKFSAYLMPKWENDEDRKEMIKNYRRKMEKKQNLYKPIPEDVLIGQDVKKVEEDMKEAEEYEKILSEEIKKEVMENTEEKITKLMHGRSVNEIVKRRMYLRNIIEYKEKNKSIEGNLHS